MGCCQYPQDRCCLCFSRRCAVILTGLLSMASDILAVLICVWAIVEPELWDRGYSELEAWVMSTHWDADVTHGVLRFMFHVNTHKELFLFVIITVCGMHTLCSLFMVMAACMRPGNRQRLLFLPWLTLDMFLLVLVVLIFITWAFLSFFVHILVAIFFPVVSGAILGLWIYCWRNVKEFFVICGLESDQMVLEKRSQKVYQKLPTPGGHKQAASTLHNPVNPSEWRHQPV